jgi:hypothetical protein
VQPENLKFGGGSAESTLHPAVLVAMLLAVLLIFLLRKKHVIVPVLFISFLVPLGQQFYVGGLHVFVLRVVILAALIRGMASMFFSKARGFYGGFNSVDTTFFLWTFFHVLAFLILFSFQSAVFANQLGFVWDILGGYLVMRFFIQEQEDIERVIRTFAFLATVLAICMLNERYRMENVFGYLGAMKIVPEMRDGLVRAQATFGHPLLAGTFGATLVPLFFWYWNSGKSKLVAVIGVLSATIMAVCASSSTPFLAYAAGIGAVFFWPFREHMRMIRWGVLIAVVALNTVMQAPVWFLISHISLFGSSSTDHRAYLVDLFIKHFSDWWLYGTNAAGTWGWDMWDTSNQYVAEGESGGLASFICFLVIIGLCFGRLGRARKAVEGDGKKEWAFWLLGCALFAHVIGFFGISYFDQSRMSWCALLVMIVAATVPYMATSKEKQAESETVVTPEVVVEKVPVHPWLGSPSRKNLVGPAGSQFKPRRS